MKKGKIAIALSLLGILACSTPIIANAENYNVFERSEDIGSGKTMMHVHNNYIFINGMKIEVDKDSDRGKFVSYLLSKVGSPYSWGAEGKAWSGSLITGSGGTTTWKDANFSYDDCIGKESFDCSGLVKAGFKYIGKDMPHYSGSQCSTSYGARVITSTSEMKPGDLAGNGGHVVVYLGNGYIIEAPQTGETVRIISMQDRFGSDSFPSSYTCVSYFD